MLLSQCRAKMSRWHNCLWQKTHLLSFCGSFRRCNHKGRKFTLSLNVISNDKFLKYGIIEGSQLESHIYRIISRGEKLNVNVAQSNLAIVGRYILTPNIFDKIKETEPSVDGEINLSDLLQNWMKSMGCCLMERHMMWQQFRLVQTILCILPWGFHKGLVDWIPENMHIGIWWHWGGIKINLVKLLFFVGYICSSCLMLFRFFLIKGN